MIDKSVAITHWFIALFERCCNQKLTFMKALFVISCLLSCFQCLAQNQGLKTCNYRIEYTMDVVRDTSELDFLKDWRYILIGDETQSRFYEANEHFNDSMRVDYNFEADYDDMEATQKALNKFMNAVSKWQKNSYGGYRVEKDFTKSLTKTTAFQLIPPAHLEVDFSTFKWQMTGKQDSLFGFLVLEAKLVYGGRNWTAWYAPAIPIPDGPYVFSGLPGLIVQIEDEDKWFSFKLASLYTEDVICHWGDYYIHELSQAIDRERYAEIAYNAQNNPKMGGIVNPDPELLLRVKRNAAWKYFVLLER
jgi:GLPGLI family protein